MDKFGATGVDGGLKNRKNPVKFDFLDLFLVFATSVVQLCKYPSSRRSDGRVGGDRWRGHSGLTILSPVILSFFPHSGRGRDRPRASSTGLREHLVPVSYFSEHHM